MFWSFIHSLADESLSSPSAASPLCEDPSWLKSSKCIEYVTPRSPHASPWLTPCFKDATSPAVGDPNRYLVSLTALTPAPVPNGPTTQELRQDAFVALRELQRELKGLVDLARVEP